MEAAFLGCVYNQTNIEIVLIEMILFLLNCTGEFVIFDYTHGVLSMSWGYNVSLICQTSNDCSEMTGQ